MRDTLRSHLAILGAVLLSHLQTVSGQSVVGQVESMIPIASTIRSEVTENTQPLLVATSFPSTTASVLSTQLRDSLTEAKEQLSADRLPNLDQARSELEEALGSLERFIQLGTPNGDNWSRFLRLAELREQLDSQRPSYQKLLELEMNMKQNYLGLEYPEFVRLRRATERFMLAARFYSQEDAFIRSLRQSIDELLSQLGESDEVTTDATEFQIGNLLSNLGQSNQSDKTVQLLQSIYSRPNIDVTINQRLVNRLVSRAVAQPRAVDECILGTHIVGHAFLNGSVSSRLLPMNDGVGLELYLSACMNSQNQGYNRGVILHTTSVSPVIATKQVFLSPHGLRSTPTLVSTNLQSTIHAIEHRLRIVRRIAQRKAGQQKPQADAIAEQRLQQRISSEFTQQVMDQVVQAQQQLGKLRGEPRPEIRRVGFTRPQVDLNSTSSFVYGSAVQATNHQLSAWQPCPFPHPGDALAVGNVHQSAVNNALETLVGGRVIRSKDLGAYAKQISGKVPEGLMEEVQGEDWSITFNPYRPIRVEFEDGVVHITLRIVRMTRESETLNELISISTAYVPSFQDNVLTLTRQGEVTVRSDRETTGLKATTMRSFLKSKFDKTFRESIVTEPLDLKRFPQMENLKLDLNQVAFKIGQGWLQVSVP